jgi:hypothetical protein
MHHYYPRKWSLMRPLLLAVCLASGCITHEPSDDDDSSVGDDDDSTGVDDDDSTSGDDDDSTSGDDDDSSVGDDDDSSVGDDDDSATSSGPWSWCPDSTDYVGESTWLQVLEVTESALYCASFDEGRTLEEEPGFKAMLRVIEGTYPLPHQEGLGSLSLPVCVQMPAGQALPVMSGTGNVHSTTSNWQDTTYYNHLLEQPMEDSNGESWWLSATIRLESTVPGEQPQALLLNGSAPAPWSGLGVDMALCPNDAQSCSQGRRFLSCNPTSYRLQRHGLTFDGGNLNLEIRMGESMASTEPAAFVLASGSLDGQSFEQTDYWKLIYNPSHHHFSRNFAVLFDAPIGSVCGLKATEVDPWGDAPPAQVHTIDCELGEIDERALSGESYEEVAP